MLKKGKVETVNLRKVSNEKECLKMWMMESEMREKKVALKELPREVPVNGREKEREPDAVSAQRLFRLCIIRRTMREQGNYALFVMLLVRQYRLLCRA